MGPSQSPTDPPEPTAEPTKINDPAAESCVSSGGTVGSQPCCAGIDAFPDTCIMGACGCGPDASEDKPVCVCPEGKCFDGTSCVEAGPDGGDEPTAEPVTDAPVPATTDAPVAQTTPAPTPLDEDDDPTPSPTAAPDSGASSLSFLTSYATMTAGLLLAAVFM